MRGNAEVQGNIRYIPTNLQEVLLEVLNDELDSGT